MKWLSLMIKRIQHARKNRRHFWIGITFASPGSTTDSPIFEIRFNSFFFRVYDFGGSSSSYGGFSQSNKKWLWQTRRHTGSLYCWSPLLPEINNEKLVLETRLKDVK